MKGLDIDYLLGGRDDFYNFLDGISKDDKVGIFSDADFDGLASAVFLTDILKNKKIDLNYVSLGRVNNVNFKEVYEKIKSKKLNKLFFTDMSLDIYENIFLELKKVSDIFLIDHHSLNEGLEDKSNIIKTSSDDCSAITIFDLGEEYISKKYENLFYGAIIKDRSYLKKSHFRLLEGKFEDVSSDSLFSSEINKWSSVVSLSLDYYKENPVVVYHKILSNDFEDLKEKSKIVGDEFSFWEKKFLSEKTYVENKNLYFYFLNPKHVGVSGIVSSLSDLEKDKTYLLVAPFDEKNFKFSARNQSGKVNMNEFCKNLVEGFEDSNGGGHFKASGGMFSRRYLEEFKRRLLQ